MPVAVQIFAGPGPGSDATSVSPYEIDVKIRLVIEAVSHTHTLFLKKSCKKQYKKGVSVTNRFVQIRIPCMRSIIAAGDIWGYQFFHRGSHRVELGGPNSGSLGNKTGHAGSHALAVVLAVTLCAALCVSRFAGTGSRIRDASGPSHGNFFLFLVSWRVKGGR